MMAAKVFISYSHKDEALRDQLEVQLAMLKRQGLIDTWHDRRMKAGEELNFEINAKLEEADVILLLISPDFLASTYCYNIEKAHALRRVQAGTAKLISVILRPCEWDQTDLRRYVLTPTDGKPITRWADADEAFLDVTRSIRKAIEQVKPAVAPASSPMVSESPSPPRSSNLRLTKTFTDADRDRFLHDAFEFIGKFFQGSLEELKGRNGQIDFQFRQLDANRFSVTVYSSGTKRSTATVFLGGQLSRSSIGYSISENGDSNSYNESVHVEHDQQSLYLKAMGMSGMMRGNNEHAKLSPIGAAELFWAMLIEPLQR
jgi:TIR domain